MDEFPWLAGAIKLIVNVPLDKLAVLIVGAPGAPTLEPSDTIPIVDAVPPPCVFLALRSIEVLTAPVNPETVPVPEEFKAGKLATVTGSQLPLGPVMLYSYPVMDEFPWLEGAIKLIVNVPLDKVAVLIVGAPGAPTLEPPDTIPIVDAVPPPCVFLALRSMEAPS